MKSECVCIHKEETFIVKTTAIPAGEYHSSHLKMPSIQILPMPLSCNSLIQRFFDVLQPKRPECRWMWRLVPVGVLVLITMLVRILTAYGPYSGQTEPPKYGDLEAQRHWMEVTLHENTHNWYRYDPDWWALDYPPLTAYHAKLCGWMAHHWWKIPEMVALTVEARGKQHPDFKLFMRATVWGSDLIMYICPVMLYMWEAAATTTAVQKRQEIRMTQHATSRAFRWFAYCLLALMQPSNILIDHGHFQYNCVCLGLTVMSVHILTNYKGIEQQQIPMARQLLASVLFSLSIGFKQIALYFSPAFFFFLLGHNWRYHKGFSSFIFNIAALGVAVIGTFTVLLGPWLSQPDELFHIMHRIFPVDRGLYEDKVANFWSAASILIKFHLRYSKKTLLRASTVLTLSAFLPAVFQTCKEPTRRNFRLCLAVCSMSFFLFGFQVHEKTILFPLTAILLLMPEFDVATAAYFVGPFGIIATFSLFPLLQREGHIFAYVALQLIFWVIYTSCSDHSNAPSIPKGRENLSLTIFIHILKSLLQRVAIPLVILVHIIAAFLQMQSVSASFQFTSRYPDLVTYMFITFAALNFGFTWLFLNAALFSNSMMKSTKLE